ncbi:NAD-binding protein, partial [Staphylococcus aureus]|nr:NAD-binding protein [Staphylococcus aureus]
MRRGHVHIIIMGCGRVGSSLAILLEKRGHDVSVIDIDDNSFRRLGPDFKG